ncbi:MAG: molybdopterin cofactor-binding domain-containing protein [Pyrinomonadaceae bacterium]
MRNLDSKSHVRGESIYLDDIPVIEGTLYAHVFDSPVAKGTIVSLDTNEASRMPGVAQVLTASDIPGENEIGGIIRDEPLLADRNVHFVGMPVAVVLADSEEVARAAASKIRIEVEEETPITDPRVAFAAGELIAPPKAFLMGNPDAAFAECDHVFEGRADVNGQEHLYIECHGAYALPMEHGGIRVYSSTQGPTAVQRCVSGVTGLPMHLIEVDVTRLGGGFGGKEDQANAWAAICAFASKVTGRPVKLALHRMDDIRMTGKRHPYSADFKIGLTKDLKIQAYSAEFFQNAGAAADLSLPVLERTLFHATNSYFVPNVSVKAYSCRTNLPPNTAFRGFGGPQGMFVMESAITEAARQIGVAPSEIQRANLLLEGDEFPYGQKAESEAVHSWEQADEAFCFADLFEDRDRFNEANRYIKKGIAIQPVCFGISFTKTPMNQARSLVHVYTDGSVAVSTGAVEMGQGVNTKIAQVAATVFGIPIGEVRVHTTNTLRIANTSPTAASAAADLNGKATEMACREILKRLLETASDLVECESVEELSISDGVVCRNGEKTDLDWRAVVSEAHLARVNLSEHAHYATPGIHFDWSTAKGHPFAYHVYGTAVIGVTVDCLRGRYKFDFVKCVHDFGQSMNTDVDFGQIEGGIVQGIGWMTLEEVVYDEMGRLRSNALSTYKVPDIYFAPEVIETIPLESDRKNAAVFNSKAVGEPPLMYGIGAYFAINDAIKAFRSDADPAFDAPMTPEKLLMALCGKKE